MSDGNDSKSEKKSRGKSLSTELPNTTMENIIEIIQAFFQLRATDQTVGTAEVSDLVTISRDTVSKQMRFLLATDILIKDGRGYIFSDLGSKYAKLISWDQQDEANSVLKDLLIKSSEIEKFIGWLKVKRSPVSYEDAVSRYGIISGIPKHRSDLKTGIEAVLNFLVESKMIEKTEDGLLRLVESEKDKTHSKKPMKEDIDIVDELGTWKEINKSRKQEYLDSSSYSIDFRINLHINSDMNPNWVKKMIIAVRKGIEEDINDSIEPK